MHHGLLVAAEGIREVLIVLKCRSHSRYIAVAKNPEAAREKLALELVPLDILIFQELNRSCAAITRHAYTKPALRRGSDPRLTGIKNARKKIQERLSPLLRGTLEVQLQCQLDLTRIARSPGIGAENGRKRIEDLSK